MSEKTLKGKKLKLRKDKHLAEGEVTGHAHRVTAREATVWDGEDGVRVLEAPDGTDVVHEEHHTGTLPALPGNERIVCYPQRETDPITKRIEQVRD